MSSEGTIVSCGPVDIRYVKSVSVEWDGETRAPKARIEFYRSHDPSIALEIEESVRVASGVAWVTVVR